MLFGKYKINFGHEKFEFHFRHRNVNVENTAGWPHQEVRVEVWHRIRYIDACLGRDHYEVHDRWISLKKTKFSEDRVVNYVKICSKIKIRIIKVIEYG